MSEILFGRNPVYESLRAGRRQPSRLWLAEGVKETEVVADIVHMAGVYGLRIERAPRQKLDEVCEGGNHQGVTLFTSKYPYARVEDMLALAEERSEPPFLLLLDLLQDVQNVGTLTRVAEAVGVHGIVIQERRGAQVTPAVVRASSGAVEHLRVASVTNLVQTMKDLREADVWFAGLEGGPEATPYHKARLDGSIGLVVGSEGEGLRRLVRETCDFLISLPMRGEVASLNAATAGSVALYAAWQARGFG